MKKIKAVDTGMVFELFEPFPSCFSERRALTEDEQARIPGYHETTYDIVEGVTDIDGNLIAVPRNV